MPPPTFGADPETEGNAFPTSECFALAFAETPAATYSAFGWYLCLGGEATEPRVAAFAFPVLRSAAAATCAGVAESKSQSPSAKVSDRNRTSKASPVPFSGVFAAAAPSVTTGGGLVFGCSGGRLFLNASASALIFGFKDSISSMHFIASATYASHNSARLLSFFKSRVKSLCFEIVSTTKLAYAINTRNSSCEFSSSRYTIACIPTKSAVLKYVSRSVRLFTGFFRALTKSEISAAVRGPRSMVAEITSRSFARELEPRSVPDAESRGLAGARTRKPRTTRSGSDAVPTTRARRVTTCGG